MGKKGLVQSALTRNRRLEEDLAAAADVDLLKLELREEQGRMDRERLIIN